jgi:RimJ/RimL family protein N-acetyltransferase
MSPGADEPGASDRTESAPHLPSSRAAVTTRLTIEPLAARHAEELFAALDDPLVGRYIGGPDVTTLAELRERIAHLLAGPEVGSGETWANWVVVLDAVIIGRLEATFHDGIAEVGYVFGPRWWGRGYGTESVAWLVDELSRRTVAETWATVDPDNDASARLLRRVGFREARPPLVPLRSYVPGDLVFVHP